MSADWQNAVEATAELLSRAGATGWEIGWDCPHVPDEEEGHECDGIRWTADARWKGDRIIAEGSGPREVAEKLALKVLVGGSCRCGRTVAATVQGLTGSLTFAPKGAGPVCVWRREGARWLPGCDAPPIEFDEGDRGNITALQAAADSRRDNAQWN